MVTSMMKAFVVKGTVGSPNSVICDWLKLPDIILVGLDWQRSVVVQMLWFAVGLVKEICGRL